MFVLQSYVPKFNTYGYEFTYKHISMSKSTVMVMLLIHLGY